MNVILNFNNLNYKIEITKTTPLSFLYKLSEKQFNVSQEKVNLLYNEKIIPNTSDSAGEYFENKSNLNIIIKEKSLSNNISHLSLDKKTKKLKLNSKSKNRFKNLPKIIKKKKPKKHFVKCQICKTKDAYFYCRKCDEFFCADCNVKYPSHNKHDLINLEEGDLRHSVDVYKKIIIDHCNIIQNAYISSNEWIINNDIRYEYLQNLIELIKEIGEKSDDLSNIKTPYFVDNEMLINIKEELFRIQGPSFKDETFDIFTEINEKEKTILNFMNCVNLQVLKSDFYKQMIELFEHSQKYLTDILQEVNKTLEEAHKLNEYGINELKEYNERIALNNIDEQLNQNTDNNNNNNNNSNSKHIQKNSNIYEDKNISAFVERMAYFSFDSKDKNDSQKFNTFNNNRRDTFNKYMNIKRNNRKLNSFIKDSETLSQKTISNFDIPLIAQRTNNNFYNTRRSLNQSSPYKLHNNNLKLRQLLSSQRNSWIKKNELVSVAKINTMLENPAKKTKTNRKLSSFVDK